MRMTWTEMLSSPLRFSTNFSRSSDRLGRLVMGHQVQNLHVGGESVKAVGAEHDEVAFEDFALDEIQMRQIGSLPTVRVSREREGLVMASFSRIRPYLRRNPTGCDRWSVVRFCRGG